jgi:putative membrane protein
MIGRRLRTEIEVSVASRLQAVCRSPHWPRWLAVAFSVWFALWAIRPWNLQDFVLEHVLTAALAAFLWFTRRAFRLSNLSYSLIFAFMCLHVVGAHYTYSEVPYEDWIGTVAGWVGHPDFRLGETLGWQRNQFDRLVHFAFGLLLAYPVREIFVRVARVRGFWAYYLPLDVMISFSAAYELMEWGVALVFGGETADTYLGTQGDVWDAQKDMALAALGGLIAMTMTALVHWHYRRDFAAELAESLRPAELSATHDGKPAH